TGHGTGYGDPVVVYDQAHSKWIAVFLASGCGGQGIGAWFSNDGATWTTGPCAHNGGSDDRESGWVDNNPSSPFFGRMYVSWNDFNVFNCGNNLGCLFATSSTDNGVTWSTPVQVSPNGIEARDEQITGDMSGNGTLYIAGMDEGGGGFPHNDTNRIFKYTDGANAWADTFTRTPFAGPCVT